MRIVLITGASSGLGREYARQLDTSAKEKFDEIWLIARRKEKLEELSRELQHTSRVLALDLTAEDACGQLEEALTAADARVHLFINCAGYAKIGNYAKVSRYDSAHMIDLNCKAAVCTTVSVLPYMAAGDRIIEICSTAAFQPLQHINIYGAGKAFLYHYTRALRMELLPRRIRVLAVCPFWIKDTEFISIAEHSEVPPEEKPPIRHYQFATTARAVVKRSLRASRAGFAVCTPSVFCFLHRLFSKVIPREALLYFWEFMRRI